MAEGRKIVKRQKLNKLKLDFSNLDFVFLFIVFLLLSFGLIMLLSASTPAANTKMHDSYYFFVRQLSGVAIGILMMLFFMMLDYHILKKYIKMTMVIGIIALIICRIPGIGAMRNGAWRWIKTPGIQLQPSEFMKPIIAICFASMASDKHYRLTGFHTWREDIMAMMPYIIILGLIFGIMLILQSHASGAIVICGIGVVIMLAAGAKIKYFLIAGAAAIPVGLILIKNDPMRMGRILSFLDPFRDTSDKSYQIVQSLIAIGSGGLFGRGLGQSVQKYAFLPEPYNDFIFSVVCEELGFLGAIVIIALFVFLVIRGLKIATEAPDTFGMLTALGIMSHIAIQTLFNISVVCSAIPTTGISLPFFSFGGTAIMVLLGELGIVLNISRQSTRLKK